MYTAYAPFQSDTNDLLSMVCQLQIFFTLLASIIRRANPDSPLMEVLLNVFVLTPVGLALFFQMGMLEKLQRCSKFILSKTSVDERFIIFIDKILGTEKLYENEPNEQEPTWENRYRGTSLFSSTGAAQQEDLASQVLNGGEDPLAHLNAIDEIDKSTAAAGGDRNSARKSSTRVAQYERKLVVESTPETLAVRLQSAWRGAKGRQIARTHRVRLMTMWEPSEQSLHAHALNTRTMMFCKKCQVRVGDQDARFCPRCATGLTRHLVNDSAVNETDRSMSSDGDGVSQFASDVLMFLGIGRQEDAPPSGAAAV